MSLAEVQMSECASLRVQVQAYSQTLLKHFGVNPPWCYNCNTPLIHIVISDKVGHIWTVRARAKPCAGQAHRKTLAFGGIGAVFVFTVEVGEVSNSFRCWCLLEHHRLNAATFSEPPSSTNWVPEKSFGQVAVMPHCCLVHGSQHMLLEAIFCWG